MIQKALESLIESDINELVSSMVAESRTLDYKELLNISDNESKREFLADVSSFANSAGGDLVIGVTEDKGVPTGVPGLEVADPDDESLRIEGIIKDGIQPRILGVGIKWVDLASGKKVLVVRIPRSWNSPHRVTFRGHDKFYGRNSAGKYPLDVTELRAAFILSEDLSTKIEKFRIDRIVAISANNLPRPFPNTAKIAIHVIPLASFGPGQTIQLKEVYDLNPQPMYAHSQGARYNFDGVISFDSSIDRETKRTVSHSYTQFYRNGIIEAVEGEILYPYPEPDGKKYIPSTLFEEKLTSYVQYCIECLKKIAIAPPFYIFITLVGAKGYEMPRGGGWHVFPFEEPQKIDRDILMLPEVAVEECSANIHDLLAVPIDALWNACGYERSKSYHAMEEQ